MSRRPVKIPSMLVGMISIGLPLMNGKVFKNKKDCPHCGGKTVPHDTKEKIFATLITPEGEKKITVRVGRYRCKECGALVYADEPFYPDTRVGSVIIDLAVSLSKIYSYSHTADIMKALGIEVDRGSVRKYAMSNLPAVQTSFLYGMQLPDSFVSVVSKCASLGASVSPDEILAASGYPSSYRAPVENSGATL
ncbi:MAG: hypothetical protein Q4Q53_06710 [Methanocorpusculum sp.]|nr:hypothetical protein [Methanocorpusculum sp.]